MIKSMTGFGRSEFQYNNTYFTIEIKSVNNRYMDINIKCPKKFTYLEDQIRQLFKQKIKRGRVDVFINYDQVGEKDVRVTPNVLLAKEYLDALKVLEEELNIKNDICVSTFIKFPDILKIEDKVEDKDQVWKAFQNGLEDSLDKLILMRKEEGNKLKEDLLMRVEYMSNLINEVNQRGEIVLLEYKTKLTKRIAEILDDDIQIDDNRLAMEVAIYADKSNVTEEVVRLSSHIKQFEKSLDQTDSVGRKLDFIIQEMNREVNTIGSKTNDIIISNIVVELKSELEKIREQVQNIE
ncbi:YicC/YloC family endoribonuclease [Serpentinicella sp. ANB-PHB4]|uniref:YicC/YloC family endoribonuclease n=1 Tax=Serpentinicella sp. ANB-PHB4 TaxID=3074076 RepID=UPI002854E6B7|nr:YicC/YloC family endoribonuclease [Serpentinicella sp. ANB-PHB4]MDR5658330.1 YicC/YloC family endoribonuclease [Serpentinicella sp. ANB-PHB4]